MFRLLAHRSPHISRQLTFFNSHNAAPVWSPDGKQIAFASNQDGSPKVWIINAEGGTPRRFSAKELCNDYFYLLRPPLTWSREQISFCNNREIGRPLLNNDAVGWIFTPVYSPDGGKIAVLWNRRPSRGIWVIFLKDSSQRPVHKSESFISPIGWSTDGNWIYALEERKVLMISVTGLKARTLVTLPFEGIGNVSMTADGRRFVCSVYESLSNIWMVENFDPEMAFQAATRQSPPQSR